MLKIGLRQKVNYLLLLSFVLVSILFTFVYVPFQNRISANILDRSTLLVRTLIERDKDGIANNILDSSKRAIQLRAEEMMQVTGMASISVHDGTGAVLVQDGMLPKIGQLSLPGPILSSGGEAVDVVRKQTHTLLRYIYELKVVGERIGFLQVHYFLDDMVYQKRQSLFFFFCLLLSILFAFGLVLNYVMGRAIIRPVITLRDLMGKVQEGEFSHRMNENRNDEFGDLATSYNAMVIDLEQSYAEVEKKSAQIRSMRTYLKNIIDSMSSMVISVDENRVITEVNQAAVEYMAAGEGADKIAGGNICDFIPFFVQYLPDVREVISGGQPLELYHQQLTRDTDERFNIAIYPLFDPARGAVVRIDDVTELYRKDEQLKQAQKMETIGTLAGGIAHDFNNILAGIVGTASLLKHSMASDQMDPAMILERVDTIEKSAGRAAELVNQLLLLASKQQMSLKRIDLNDSVRHIVTIAKNSFDKSIDVQVHYAAAPAIIHADASQVEQILLNLCVNGSHAMTIMHDEHTSWGGVLAIEVEAVGGDKAFSSKHRDADHDAYWCVTVRDSGVGMGASVLDKLFDPFFTTKEHGSGTGLGLSVAYSILRQHGGFIDVSSQPGKGSCFKLYFPSAGGDEPAPVERVSPAAARLTQGSGTILIIDDEELVRTTATIILEEAGYQVKIAENGEEGLELYRTHMDEIDGVLLDLLMPKMQGHEVFVNLKQLNPEVRVLMASGFVSDERAQEALTMGVKGFIQKPFTLEGLSQAVARLLKP